MLRITALILFSVALAGVSWGVGGCGGGSSDNPPDISGIYDLTNTECPGAFDDTVNVVQDGDNLIIQATSPGFIDVEGSINDDGEFDVGNSGLSCEGQFVSGVATAQCSADDGTDCQVTYTLR